jgi:DNA-binding NtrC family response regulator
LSTGQREVSSASPVGHEKIGASTPTGVGADSQVREDSASIDNAVPATGLTTAEVLLRAMRLRGVSTLLPQSNFPLHLFVVEPDEHLREPLLEIGRQMGFTVRGAAPGEVEALLDSLECDVVLLDLSPEVARLEVLRHLRLKFPRVPILVTAAFASVQAAVEALRNGATDFLTKPFSLEELTTTLHLAAEQRSFDVELRRMQHQMRSSPVMQQIASASPAMQKLMSMVTRVAVSEHPVIVLGESGSGKERVARALHDVSMVAAGRRSGDTEAKPLNLPFLQVLCTTTDAAALETELFGSVHHEGTSRRDEQVGLLTVEGGGTLFLDEVDGLPVDLQSKLLRAMKDRAVKPAGSAVSRPVTVRLIASSSRNLPSLVERGEFRKDLYFRLNVVNLRVPPLRQRREDLPLLIAACLEKHSEERHLSFSLGPDAMRVLMEYEWPGNVRELEAVLERACALSSGPVLHLADLPTQLHQVAAAEHEEAIRIDGRVAAQDRPAEAARGAGTFSSADIQIEPIAEMERRMILLALEKLNGDKIMTAKLLGIGKTTLYRKLKEYGIGELAA